MEWAWDVAETHRPNEESAEERGIRLKAKQAGHASTLASFCCRLPSVINLTI